MKGQESTAFITQVLHTSQAQNHCNGKHACCVLFVLMLMSIVTRTRVCIILAYLPCLLPEIGHILALSYFRFSIHYSMKFYDITYEEMSK